MATFSQSHARNLIFKSPLHAYAYHPELGGLTKPPTEAMITGSILHALILEGGKGLTLIDADSYKSKDAREQRDAVLAAGELPVLAPRYAQLKDAAGAIVESLEASPLGNPFVGGEAEVRVEWEEAGVRCKGRIDYLRRDATMVFDLKTTADASIEAVRRKLASGDAMQAAAYLSAMKSDGFYGFVGVYVEPEPPYAVTPVELAPSMWTLGESQWDRALRTWRTCLATGSWPGPGGDKVAAIEAPRWALQQEEERE